MLEGYGEGEVFLSQCGVMGEEGRGWGGVLGSGKRKRKRYDRDMDRKGGGGEKAGYAIGRHVLERRMEGTDREMEGC